VRSVNPIAAGRLKAVGEDLNVATVARLPGARPLIPKIFTPESARAALANLRPHAETMRRLFRSLELRQPVAPACDQVVDPGYFTTMLQFYETVVALRAAGVLIRDPGRGRLDFPAWRAGRPVLLCWQVGEPDVRFWQDTCGEAAPRRLVDEGPWEPPRPLGSGRSNGDMLD
jgi:hypothetical protein